MVRLSQAKRPKMRKLPRRLDRRRFVRGATFGMLGFCTTCAVDAWGVEPEWIEVTETDLPLRKLGSAWQGTRLVHVSDLHCSRTVTDGYLLRCMQRINRLQPDLVVLTGDYVTLDERNLYRQRVVDLVGHLRARLGVFACLGNHDYDVWAARMRPRSDRCHFFCESFRARGIEVLRNRAVPLVQNGQRLWMAGVGDLWAGDCDPQKALGELPADETRIVLAHNPDSFEQLLPYRPEAILSGHTHGGQIRLPFLRPPLLPIKNRQYHAGLFDLDGTRLYVTRGLGRLGRIRFRCRPEITVLKLTAATH